MRQANRGTLLISRKVARWAVCSLLDTDVKSVLSEADFYDSLVCWIHLVASTKISMYHGLSGCSQCILRILRLSL
ncbi:MAG: hypothetical protein OEM02_15270 [Desulfobulbaceae bacterium]|nr:hypothetical protein [Desulfobulbaceae bacterium]